MFKETCVIIENTLRFPHLVVDDEWIFTCAYHGWLFGYIDNALEFYSRTYCEQDYFLVDRGNGEVLWLPYSANDAYIDAEDMYWN